MNKILGSIAATLLGVTVFSADVSGEVLKVRPETSGRDLTIEDATVGGLYPSSGRYAFVGNEVVVKNGGWKWRRTGAPVKPEAPGFVAYTEDGSLYLRYRDGRKVLVSESPEEGVVFGETVSRHEFNIDTGIFLSPDSTKIAFYRKDERAVSKFPLLDIGSRTGTLREIRYPMAGMASEKLSLGVYDIAQGSTVYLDINDFDEERYLTNVCWSPSSTEIYVAVLDRAQQNMHLNRYSAEDGKLISTVLEEHNDRFVEPEDPVWFVKGREDVLIYRTDNRDGFKNLYLIAVNGAGITRLTVVDADVEYLGNDGKYVYYTSAEVSPVENHLFRIALKKGKKNSIVPGKKERLTYTEGWHDITMSEDLTLFLDKWSSFDNPGATELCSCDGKRREVLRTAKDPLEGFAACEVEFGTTPSADGSFENYYRLFKPKGFDPSKKYPIILYVYGGPHSQMVRNSWLAQIRNWEMYMAERGYVVYVQDNRGTRNRGAEFEKAIWHNCGKEEMADQIAGLRRILDEPWADSSRVGVHGWSYGGFMTISLMTSYPEIFKVGVAGGPVIDWKWYEVMYGERYMGTPETNPEGFKSTSLVAKAENLKGRLLICQGSVDDTVLPIHSLTFAQECVSRWIPLDYFPYPTAEHNVRGSDRVHLMAKISEYFESNL